jgi:hypothetical protein
MDVQRAAQEFRESDFVARTFPPSIRAATLPDFRWQHLINERVVMEGGDLDEGDLYAVLAESELVSLPLWLLGSEQAEQRIAARAGSRPGADRIRGIGALAARDYASAVQSFRRARAGRGRQPRVAGLEIFALCMAGNVEEASRVARQLLRAMPGAAQQDAYWEWLEAAFGMPDPRG